MNDRRHRRHHRPPPPTAGATILSKILIQISLALVCITTIICCHVAAANDFDEFETLNESTNHTNEDGGAGHEIVEEHEEEVEEPYAVLYPSLILVFGTLIYLGLTRWIAFLPYTACMFLLGTIMGLAVSATEAANPSNQNHIHQTVLLWQGINSEVLLLVFLPGLIFKDSLGQNVHLFDLAIGQLFIFAFPLVLAGTLLTALVAFYILPYDWSFNLSMTFGSILSATDPVAVAALLDEVGKFHIPFFLSGLDR